MSTAGRMSSTPRLVSITRTSDSRIVGVNSDFEQVLGFTSDEIIGKTSEELNIWKDKSERKRVIDRILREGQVSEIPINLRTRSGDFYNGLLSAQTIEIGEELFIYSITESVEVRSRRELALQAAEARYRELFQNATEGIYQSSPDGLFLDVNPALAQMLGYASPADMIASISNIATEFYVNEKQRNTLRKELSDAVFSNIETEVYRKDGSRIWVSENFRTVHDDKDNIKYFEGTIVDISARKAAEVALQQSEEKYRTLVDHSQDGVFISQEGIYLYVNTAYAEMIGYQPAEMIGQDYSRFVAPESREEQNRLRARRRAGSTDTHFYELYLLHKDGKTRVLASARVGAITYNGKLATTGTVRNITAERKNQQNLYEAERKYRSIFENAVEGIYQSTPDGKFDAVNPALVKLLGYDSPEDLVESVNNIGVQIYSEPNMRNAILKELENTGVISNKELQIQRKDGSTIWVSENSMAIRDEDGNIICFEGTLVDITARKITEEALQQSEERYRLVVENTHDGIFVNRNHNYVFVNQAYADMLGYTVDELAGLSWRDVVAPEDIPMVEEFWQTLRTQPDWVTHSYEVTLLKKDRKTRVVAAISSSPVPGHGGDLGSSLGTVRDVTSEKHFQQELLEAERKYRSIFENAVAGMYQSTPEGRFVDANQALADIFGYDSPSDLIENLQDIKELYANPDDRNTFLDDLHHRGSVLGLEYQIRRKDSQTIWISQNARVVRNEDGSIRYYEGAIQDITARKEAERERHNSEQRYRALVDQSQVGVFINVDGKYTYVNQAYAEMLGYSQRELNGKHYREVIAPEELSAADDRFHRRMRGEHVANDYEARLLHKDGQTRIVTSISIRVVDQDGMKLHMATVRDITEQKRVERQLRHNATHDPLTGLPNRTLFIERLQKAMSYSQRVESPNYAVLFLDLDAFKVVNDSLGHAMGDQLLVEISHRLKKCLRPWDTIARHGGDEFTILIEQLHSEDDATEVADRIHNELRHPFQLGDHEVFTNASIGITLGDPGYSSTEEVLRDADTAMYQSKETHKAGYVIFDTAMHDIAKSRLKLETELRQALERNEFRIHYQPIVDIKSRRLESFEALLRWQHPTRGLLSPNEFLSVAEETGLIMPIGWWVLRTTCAQLATWRSRHARARKISINVNIADKQFSHVDLPGKIASAIRDSRIPPESLHLEITESVFMENPDAGAEILARLKALGVGLHMDDFGTGYSSLSYLSNFPLDTLKVDRSFIIDIVENRDHQAIVKTIIHLATELRMDVIAEGIETPEQIKAVKKLGCGTAQGYLFSKAVDPDTAELLFDLRAIPFKQQTKQQSKKKK